MFGLSTEASPSKSATKGNFSIRGLLKKKSLSSKTKALSRQPEVPNLRESKPTPKMERSKSAPNLPTITEERDETMEADVEDNEQVSPDTLSSQEVSDSPWPFVRVTDADFQQDTEAQEDTNLAITAKPAAGRLSYSPVSASSSDLQIELKTIDKRVSELESCLDSTQEQLKERDEQLFECQHATSEHIAEKIAKVVDSKDQEI